VKKLTIIFVILTAACASQPKRKSAEPEWVSRMHSISATYLNLTPLVSDSKQFADPGNRQVLDVDLRRLAELGQETARDPKAPNADPMIEFLANRFAAEARQAYAAFKADDLAWTRFALQRAGDQCIACHTRADRGAKNFALAWTPQLGGLSLTEQIEFWVANRQYAKAMTEAERLAAEAGTASVNSLAWLSALQKVMTAALRVSGDTRGAERLTRVALQNQGVPLYMRNDLKEWLRDIQVWRAVKDGATERARLQTALNLIEKNRRLAFRDTQGAFIANLRASKILHELLENSTSPVYLDALQAAGAVSESLGDSGLGQYYFEACIRHLPHSLPAERCYGKLVNSIRRTKPYLESGLGDNYTSLMVLDELRRLAHFDEDHPRPRMNRTDGP